MAKLKQLLSKDKIGMFVYPKFEKVQSIVFLVFQGLYEDKPLQQRWRIVVLRCYAVKGRTDEALEKDDMYRRRRDMRILK